jgi:F0F1-type ATP synthase membrane subunit b/b'
MKSKKQKASKDKLPSVETAEAEVQRTETAATNARQDWKLAKARLKEARNSAREARKAAKIAMKAASKARKALKNLRKQAKKAAPKKKAAGGKAEPQGKRPAAPARVTKSVEPVPADSVSPPGDESAVGNSGEATAPDRVSN